MPDHQFDGALCKACKKCTGFTMHEFRKRCKSCDHEIFQHDILGLKRSRKKKAKEQKERDAEAKELDAAAHAEPQQAGSQAERFAAKARMLAIRQQGQQKLAESEEEEVAEAEDWKEALNAGKVSLQPGAPVAALKAYYDSLLPEDRPHVGNGPFQKKMHEQQPPQDFNIIDNTEFQTELAKPNSPQGDVEELARRMGDFEERQAGSKATPQIGTSIRGDLCQGSGKALKENEPVVWVAENDSKYAPEELKCSTCQITIADLGIWVHQEHIYCERHWAEASGYRRCEVCDELIFGEATEVGGRYFHHDHFVCEGCDKPLSDEIYLLAPVGCCEIQSCHKSHSDQADNVCWEELNLRNTEDEVAGPPFCQDCYSERFAPKCPGCNKATEAYDGTLIDCYSIDEVLWHVDCYKCSVCSICCAGLLFGPCGQLLCPRHAKGGGNKRKPEPFVLPEPCVLRVDILRGLSLYGDANFGSQDLFARATLHSEDIQGGVSAQRTGTHKCCKGEPEWDEHVSYGSADAPLRTVLTLLLEVVDPAVGVLARSCPLEFTMVEEELENIGHDTENHLELAKVGRTAQFQYSMAPLTDGGPPNGFMRFNITLEAL